MPGTEIMSVQRLGDLPGAVARIQGLGFRRELGGRVRSEPTDASDQRFYHLGNRIRVLPPVVITGPPMPDCEFLWLYGMQQMVRDVSLCRLRQLFAEQFDLVTPGLAFRLGRQVDQSFQRRLRRCLAGSAQREHPAKFRPICSLDPAKLGVACVHRTWLEPLKHVLKGGIDMVEPIQSLPVIIGRHNHLFVPIDYPLWPVYENRPYPCRSGLQRSENLRRSHLPLRPVSDQDIHRETRRILSDGLSRGCDLPTSAVVDVVIDSDKVDIAPPGRRTTCDRAEQDDPTYPRIG